jgi:hypothetical protein
MFTIISFVYNYFICLQLFHLFACLQLLRFAGTGKSGSTVRDVTGSPDASSSAGEENFGATGSHSLPGSN